MNDRNYYTIRNFAENRDWSRFSDFLHEFPDVVFFLDEKQAGIVFDLAGISGAFSWIEQVISLGADPNIRTHEGETAIGRSIAMDSVLNPTIENMVSLLKMGADPNATTNSGSTPLVFALEMNKLDHARELVKFGADAHKKTSDVFPVSAADIIRSRGCDIF